MIESKNKINIIRLKKVNHFFGDKINKRIIMKIRKKEAIHSSLSIIINQLKVNKFIKGNIKILQENKEMGKQTYPGKYHKIKKMIQIFGKI